MHRPSCRHEREPDDRWTPGPDPDDRGRPSSRRRRRARKPRRAGALRRRSRGHPVRRRILGPLRRSTGPPRPRRHRVVGHLVAGRAGARGRGPSHPRDRPAGARTNRPLDGSSPFPRQRSRPRRVRARGPPDAGEPRDRRPLLGRDDGRRAWLVRGDPAAGGLVPDSAIPALAAAVGPGHVLTIAGGPHAPQRLLPEATTLALLRALGVDGRRLGG